ncbi:hypothetical protein CANCADRAFT_102912 [Tortispora caseinolytica NRRL Y-17796]|uniref:Uncharacterized protein n=1 Tax=Tortispora caseinolytica NRRL Y-17796 TaxID=767744 RepID=A0A1E4TEK1_9ASCO|nr:hypothetical protein CANCADRAFT_102912 [Tortispora caseinolytica NRRL Y-17796]
MGAFSINTDKFWEKAGYTNDDDIDARARCFAYLTNVMRTVAKMIDDPKKSSELSSDELQNYKNHHKILQSTYDILLSSVSDTKIASSDKFWKEWSRTSTDIVSLGESLATGSQLSKKQIQDKRYDLESGRRVC